MSRRVPRFITATLLAAVLLPFTTGAAEIKIATVAPEGSTWMKDMRAAAREVRDRTEGRVVLKIYGGGIQGNDRKVLRKIRIGQLHGGVFTSTGLVERYPDIVLYGLPMLFDSQDEVDYVRSKLDPTLAEGLTRAGFVSFGFAGGGFAYPMSNQPVRRLEDLRGKKIWVPEGDQSSYRAMQALDLSPVVLPVTDVLTGLETGLIDIVAAPPVGAIVLQWHTKTKYVTAQPLSYTLGFLAIDRKVFDRLPSADRRALSEVMTRLYARFDAQNVADNRKAEEALRASGLGFVKLDPAEVPRWRAAVARSTDAMADEGLISPDLLRQVRALVAEYRSGRGTGPAPAP